MYIPYSEISDQSRVWIYQSDKLISSSQRTYIEQQLMDLCNNWNAHGQPIKASFQIDDWFICLFADESHQQASGCSIDSSVKIITDIAQKYQIDFFNRLNIVFKNENQTKIIALTDFKKIISPKIKIYNNLVTTKKEMEEKWLIPVEESWLNKYL